MRLWERWMNKSYMTIAAAIALLAAPNASLAQRAGFIKGAGPMTCGEFIESKGRIGADHFYAQWTLGFLSYHNVRGTNAQVEIPDTSTILLHAEKYCRDNPLQKYHHSASSLLDELGGYRPAQSRK